MSGLWKLLFCILIIMLLLTCIFGLATIGNDDMQSFFRGLFLGESCCVTANFIMIIWKEL